MSTFHNNARAARAELSSERQFSVDQVSFLLQFRGMREVPRILASSLCPYWHLHCVHLSFCLGGGSGKTWELTTGKHLEPPFFSPPGKCQTCCETGSH